MSYSPNGKIMDKALDAQYNLNGNTYSNSYQNSYNYIAGSNKPDYINTAGNFSHGFHWDGNGNMLVHAENNTAKLHCWDEENRLMVVADESRFGYYIYDAGGERVYKLTGDISYYNINNHQYSSPQFTMTTLYASPYLVATTQGYTKHYYAGNDRIASKLGGGGLSNINLPIVSTSEIDFKHVSRYEPYQRFWDSNCANIPQPCCTLYLHLYDWQELQHPERDLYFYHPDHIGSSSWITDASGNAIQHLQYLPFGEARVDQRTTGWNTMYSFSSKERDGESGYSYFGARYYDSDISIWLSVDPYASSYPSLTPYNYCANSPVMYHDPNGESLTVAAIIGICAAVGAIMGGYSGYQIAEAHGASGWAMFGYIMGGATIGALAGAASSGVGCVVSGALANVAVNGVVVGLGGVAGGAISGATAGTVGGLINGIGMATLGGQSFQNVMLSGLKSAGIGMAIGAVMGALTGGAEAFNNNKNVWTGRDIAMGRTAWNFKNTDLNPNVYLRKTTSAGVNWNNKSYIDKISKTHPSNWTIDLRDDINNAVYPTGTTEDGKVYSSLRDTWVGNMKGRGYMEMWGHIPDGCEVQISFDSNPVFNLSAGSYYNNNFTMPIPSGTQYIHIEMTGTVPSYMNNVSRVPFNTRISAFIAP
jgi:RHS repeat-associated protein